MEKADERLALRLSRSFEEFDNILVSIGCKTDSEKISYLEEQFDVHVVHTTVDDQHGDYIAMAYAVRHYL